MIKKMITIADIKNRAEKLLEYYQPIEEPAFFREKAILAYCQQTLKSLIETIEIKSSSLEAWLANNWGLVQGTCLSYTALPDLDVTQLIIEVAIFVAQQKKEQPGESAGALHYLMPSITRDSLISLYPNQYPHLCPTNETKKDVNVLDIIKTHIEGDCGKYLIPVALIFYNSALNKIPNPYYDVFALEEDASYIQKHGEKYQGYLSPQEYQRLANHSPETRAFVEAKNHLTLLLNDSSHFLGQLTNLCRHLHFNSVDVNGKEHQAGAGAYTAIIQFFEYYKMIPAQEKSTLPPELSHELTFLLNLVTKPHQQSKSPPIHSCIATRRTLLQNAIAPHHTLLSAINIDGESKTALIKEAKNTLEDTKKNLMNALDSQNYSGYDPLNLTPDLFQALSIRAAIRQPEDLQMIQALEPSEILSFFKGDTLKIHVLWHFHTIDDIVLFILETKIGQLKAFLTVMGEKIFEKLIQTSPELIRLLKPLGFERYQVVFHALKNKIHHVVKSKADIAYMLAHLHPTQRPLMVQLIKEGLIKLLESGQANGLTLQYLNAQDRDYLYHSLTSLYPLIQTGLNFINSADELIGLMKHANSEETLSILKTLPREKLLHLLQPFHEFKKVFTALESEHYPLLYSATQHELSNIIQTMDNLILLLDDLKPASRLTFIELIKDFLPKLMTSQNECLSLLTNLTPEEFKLIGNSLKEHLMLTVNSRYHIKRFAQQLDKTHQVLFLDLMAPPPEVAESTRAYRRKF